MRVRLLNMLLLAALLLATSRLTLLLREPSPALPPVETGEAAAPATPAGAEGEMAPPEQALPGAYDVIVARDLFSPTRGVVQPAPVAAGRPAAPPAAPPKLTLYGVVIVNGERTAFLQEGGQDTRPKKVKEKDHIGGGIVSAIRPDGVTVVFGGAEISIPLRSPKEVPATTGAGAAAAAARSRMAPGVQRRPAQPQPVPGRMPMPAAPGQPAATGMPVFPADAEAVDETAEPEEMLPEEFPDEGEEQQMPIEEIME